MTCTATYKTAPTSQLRLSSHTPTLGFPHPWFPSPPQPMAKGLPTPQRRHYSVTPHLGALGSAFSQCGGIKEVLSLRALGHWAEGDKPRLAISEGGQGTLGSRQSQRPMSRNPKRNTREGFFLLLTDLSKNLPRDLLYPQITVKPYWHKNLTLTAFRSDLVPNKCTKCSILFHVSMALAPRWFGERVNKEWEEEERAYLSHSWTHCSSHFRSYLSE